MSFAEWFAAPWAWPLLLLAPSAWLLQRSAERTRIARLAARVGPRGRVLHDLASARVRAARLVWSAALLFAALALLQPLGAATGRGRVEVGLDLVFVLDVSRSMLAEDASGATDGGARGARSRLDHASAELAALAARARGDRLALVLFAGAARTAAPLTRDVAAVADLARLADPTSIAVGGSDLGPALDAATALLVDAAPGASAIVVLGDGEDHAGNGERAARAAAASGTAVHVVGFGSRLGAQIPERDARGAVVGFLRDATGAEVTTALGVDELQRVAAAGGGRFVEASARARPLLELYESELAPLQRARATEGDERKQLYQWPLALVVALWLCELGLGERRRRRSR